jgi:hypothetical protein
MYEKEREGRLRGGGLRKYVIRVGEVSFYVYLEKVGKA